MINVMADRCRKSIAPLIVIALLPHTKFIGERGGSMSEDRFSPDGRIVPDIAVVPTVDDIISGNEPVMDTAIALVHDK